MVDGGLMLIEVVVAIGSGVAAHSISLIAFGADSLIELASADVLLWRLDVEIRRGAEFSERIERRARRTGAALLFALAVYVVVSAAYGLWTREGQEFSPAGLVLAVLARSRQCGGSRGQNACCRPDRRPGTPRRCRRVRARLCRE